MSSKAIKTAWQRLDGPTGPNSMKDFHVKKDALQTYSKAILAAEDKKRIKAIGRKYLLLAADGELTKEQFVGFLKNASIYEHWKA
jgi:hypothetical protein